VRIVPGKAAGEMFFTEFLLKQGRLMIFSVPEVFALRHLDISRASHCTVSHKKDFAQPQKRVVFAVFHFAQCRLGGLRASHC